MELKLLQTEHGLTLTDGTLELTGDFTRLLPRLKANNLTGELVVRAARIRNASMPLTVLDATAGLGEDSFLLAAAGYEVTLYEYDTVIGQLLADALQRAALVPELAEAATRMHFVAGDSIAPMREIARQCNVGGYQDAAAETSLVRPDIILLDPMFPAREKSGLVKKKFQLLQQLELPCSNETELLEAALSVHPHKIIIKRPARGPWLAGRKPDYCIAGKGIRYDCICNSL